MDELDRMLSADDTLEPSSGFAVAAMRAVQDAAEEPPPLPFPWTRLFVGFSACATLTALGATSLPPTATTVAPAFGYAIAILLATVALLRGLQLVAEVKAS